jgi:uncharacterized membrane protein
MTRSAPRNKSPHNRKSFSAHSASVALAALAAAGVMLAPEATATNRPLPSFQCYWSEPFIGVQVSTAGVVLFQPLEEAGEAGEDGDSLEKALVTTTGSQVNVSGVQNNGRPFRMVIKDKPGYDGMSDFEGSHTGEILVFDDMGPLKGLCIKHGDGTKPRRVVGVAETDELNVRAKPNASSAILTSLGPREYAWAYPSGARNGWVKVTAAKYPQNELGRIGVVSGWVNGKYLR